MSKVFILVHKDTDDYSSIPPEYEKVFIFEKLGNKPDIPATLPKLGFMLDNAKVGDKIVFNGPTWIIALAGYIWLTNDDRQGIDTFIFDNQQHRYVLHSDKV